ncbi:MAG: BON domain-containing protein [Gemmataceae bacterium]|nr:BON domain-containing protein [Gemmataceae bacterium]
MPAGPNQQRADLSADVRHTIKARKLLADDPALATWNLGVVVTDRVAVLWGPAPSAEIAFRAEERLRKMVDLVAVQNNLFVSESLEAAKGKTEPTARPDPLLPALPLDPALGFGTPGAKGEPARSATQDRPGPQIQVLPPEPLSDPVTRKLPTGDKPGPR